MLALFLVALSVGLDNLGAAAAIGVAGVDADLRLRIAVVFGTFEAITPIMGLLLGHSVAGALGGDTDVVAGIVMCVVGAYAVGSELLAQRGEPEPPARPSMGKLVVLGATLSIDNVAVGFALGSYHVNIVLAALVIAAVSVALTLVGLEVGGRVGRRLGRRSEMVGGLILVVVGIAVGAGLL